VSEQDGVEAVDSGAESLLAEVGRGVDDDIVAVVREQQRRAEAVVAGIFGVADAAMTAERGDAHGSSGAENGDS